MCVLSWFAAGIRCSGNGNQTPKSTLMPLKPKLICAKAAECTIGSKMVRKMLLDSLSI